MLKKILETGLGWSLSGPTGDVVGWWLAGKVTTAQRESLLESDTATSRLTDFFMVLLMLYAKIMRTPDGTPHPIATGHLTRHLSQTFSPEQTQALLTTLPEFQQRNFELAPVLAQLCARMPLQERVQLVHLLFGMVLVCGPQYKHEGVVVHEIAYSLGISERVFYSMRMMLQHELKIIPTAGKRTFSKEDTSSLDVPPRIAEARAILGFQHLARTQQIRYVYHELMQAHDPKKLKNLGEEIVQSAQDQSQKIVFAYRELLPKPFS